MKKTFLLIASFLMCCSTFAKNAEHLSISKPTNSRVFTVNLKCDSPLSVEKFHSCHLDILGLKHFQTGKKLENILVGIDGGMPAHAHGLPTAPKVIWSDKLSTYNIHGLKFNMLGKWQLHFQIEDKKYKLKDIVTLDFTI